MKKQITLSVPTPCSEKWNNFTTTLEGGFCNSCDKEVIDFSQMTDDEIFDYFNEGQENTCGRFTPEQLNIYSDRKSGTAHYGFNLLRTSFLSLSLLLFISPVFAQGSALKPSLEEVIQFHSFSNEKNTPVTLDNIISGVVTDEYNEPLPGINIFLKGNEQEGTISDGEGKFKFPKTLKEGDVLIFTFIGFETQEYIVPKEPQDRIEIHMVTYTEILGEVVVDEIYEEKPSGIARLWSKVKGLF